MLAACMIVKDEAHCLKECLEGISPHVDGVYIYDTGSTDGTQDIARRCGAEVVQGQWRNDFARARNKSYELPPKEFDWVVYLDADDTLGGAEALKELAEDALPFVTGFSFPYLNAWGNLDVNYSTLRLTRRDRYYWKWPLHEQLVPVGEHKSVESDKVLWSQNHSLEDRQAHTQRNLDFLFAYLEEHELDDWLASAIVLTMIEQGRARDAYKWLVENDFVMEITRRAG